MKSILLGQSPLFVDFVIVTNCKPGAHAVRLALATSKRFGQIGILTEDWHMTRPVEDRWEFDVQECAFDSPTGYCVLNASFRQSPAWPLHSDPTAIMIYLEETYGVPLGDDLKAAIRRLVAYNVSEYEI